jgi:hypothetical protein
VTLPRASRSCSLPITDRGRLLRREATPGPFPGEFVLRVFWAGRVSVRREMARGLRPPMSALLRCPLAPVLLRRLQIGTRRLRSAEPLRPEFGPGIDVEGWRWRSLLVVQICLERGQAIARSIRECDCSRRNIVRRPLLAMGDSDIVCELRAPERHEKSVLVKEER